MVDGRPWVASKDNPTKLLIESARKLYGTSNEELMDNAKQFAYYPVALLKGVQQLHERHDQHEVQDRRRRLRPLLRHGVQRQAEWRLAGDPLQRHREQHRPLGVPQRDPALGEARPGTHVDAGSRGLARAEDDRRRSELQGLDRRQPGARVHARQRARARAATTPRRIPICSPRTIRCSARLSKGESACGRRPTAPATSRIFVVSPK